MLTQQSIRDFLAQSDYDIRESGNGRWIDQKCTPDVVCAVADFICNYVADDPSPGSCPFTSKEIWHSEYASQYVEAVFKKPTLKNKNAKHEYDKFFQQPMELLAYANVLGKQKRKGKNYYWVKQINILEYIALRERNALIFLVLYIEKTLHDSGLWPFFHTFLQSPSSKTYTEVRNAFFAFTLAYTKINKPLECGRIFTKVLNPLAYSHNTRGTKGGDLSADLITYDMLMYNRPNFRDIYADKPKGVTRKEYAATHPIEINEDYYRYQSNKATRFLRIFNDDPERADRTSGTCTPAGQGNTHAPHLPEIALPGDQLLSGKYHCPDAYSAPQLRPPQWPHAGDQRAVSASVAALQSRPYPGEPFFCKRRAHL